MDDKAKHPLQPLVLNDDGVVRFKPNAIVRFLLDAGPYDLNKLAMMPWSVAVCRNPAIRLIHVIRIILRLERSRASRCKSAPAPSSSYCGN